MLLPFNYRSLYLKGGYSNSANCMRVGEVFIEAVGGGTPPRLHSKIKKLSTRRRVILLRILVAYFQNIFSCRFCIDSTDFAAVVIQVRVSEKSRIA